MNNKNTLIEKKLKSIILKSTTLNYTENDITDDSDLIIDFNFNSIDIIQLVVNIENDFQIEIEDDFFIIEAISKYNNLKIILLIQ